ncbi:MAG: sugar kinase [Actinobacteria bacterium]|nr:sugar kinase [Actinomycetota bacterium]
MRYLVGIDGGSQSTKVVVYDETGLPVCEGRVPLRPNATPAPGVVEHPDDDLWDSLVGACRQAMAAFPGDPRDIAAVGLCTIRFCRAMLHADGSLAGPVLSWMDARVSRPYEHVDPSVAWVTASSGYVGHRLTGAFVDTQANYAGQWPFDGAALDWLPPGPDGGYPGTDVRRDMLFDLDAPGEVLGTLTAAAAAATGLPAGVPVVATANDKAVEALGCGLVDSGGVLVSLGTYVAGMVVGDRWAPDLQDAWTNFACVPGRYLFESHGVRRGMWTVSWLRDLLGAELATRAAAEGVAPEDVMNAAAERVPPGSDGLMTVLDWLAPTDAPYRKGVMLGFDGRHGWPHLYRSVVEGLALTMRTCLDAMYAELRLTPSHAVVSGGGAASALTLQVFADALGMPVARPAVSSAASLGAAICAAVGAGLAPDVATAAARMVRPGPQADPRPDVVELYERLREIHGSIRTGTDPVLARSYEIFH